MWCFSVFLGKATAALPSPTSVCSVFKVYLGMVAAALSSPTSVCGVFNVYLSWHKGDSRLVLPKLTGNLPLSSSIFNCLQIFCMCGHGSDMPFILFRGTRHSIRYPCSETGKQKESAEPGVETGGTGGWKWFHVLLSHLHWVNLRVLA